MINLTSSCHCKAFSYPITILEDVQLPLSETTCSCDACRYRTGQISFLSLSAKLTRSFPPSEALARLQRYDQKCGFVIDQETLQSQSQSQSQSEVGDEDTPDGLNKYSQNTTCGGTMITSFFCGICGTKIYLQVASLTGEPEIGMWTLGALDRVIVDEKPIVKLKGHHFLEDTVDGGIFNIWRTFQGEPLKKYHDGLQEWIVSKKSTVQEEEYMHLHCKCESFNVYVRRPQPALPVSEDCYWYQGPYDEKGVPKRYMAGWCACDSCRQITGSSLPAHPWVEIPLIDIRSAPSPDAQPYLPIPMTPHTTLPGLTLYKSSPDNEDVSRYHCSTCGASIMYYNAAKDFMASFAVGLNGSKNGVMNTSWISWWFGLEGVTEPMISAKEDGQRRWGGLMDEFEQGLLEWGKEIRQ
ncbi:uncharacterized protein I303_107533 [Kwoniella dejecticola CBS 10117]|uniref:CENP-V/GFA domain-containing protein n=1 Tax=Kwoniella dejecticola CBS 10117 TaxID=1296121 RepID=A0A1A6A000_9TREE|nr:uncharacterized protein I303_06938 [Kwoniella dejecticola CBS 10117]OBR83373.1 hypothetical protein I303_06938 [Kwoniella dejecticola CBS 10117]